MKITELKQQLRQMEKDDLILLICKIYKGSPTGRDMLDVEFGGNQAEELMVNECKRKIAKVFEARTLSLRTAKKVISDFKKVCHNKENLAELMLYYVECGVEFTNTYGDIDDPFYHSIATVFSNFVKEINQFPDDSYYVKNKKRIDAIYIDSKDIGWGFGDEIDDIYHEICWL